jgi:hypothetical protein
MTTAPVESRVDEGPAAAEGVVREERAALFASHAAAVAGPARSRRHLWVLLAICLIGVALRFSYMHRPLLWGDDAYTIYRTHADYQAMLDVLQNDGFTPLHYELYWLLGRAAGTEESVMTATGTEKIRHSTGLTPTVIRILPATFGALMVPGMYFLAVQLVRRRVALVVALVTACSAYLLGYSRDGKMYIMQWCFSAWSVATLLWWFRTDRRVAWLAWVASSLWMASSHMTGMALLPIEAIFFLTRSRVHWRQSILFVIGLAIAILPPAGYITQFNRWAQESVEDFGFEVEGLTWVVQYNAGRTGPELAKYATSAYLFSWEWPKPTDEAPGNGRDPTVEQFVPGWIQTTLKAATVLFLVLAAVGMLPWSRRLRGVRDDDPPAPQPWWRVTLWLGAWLLVPGYFMYCRSVPGFASPGDWWRELALLIAGPSWVGADGRVASGFWWALATLVAVVAALVFAFPRFRRGMVWLIPGVAIAALAVALLRHGAPATPPTGARWVDAAFAPLLRWASWMSEPAVFTALAVLLPGLVLYYCGVTFTQRAQRLLQFALVFAALLGLLWVVYDVVDDKYKKEVAQLLEPSAASTGAKAIEVLARHSESSIESAQSRVNARVWQSIFMPRYIGFVWIAFCLILCSLLMRLPTRPLRVVAVTLLVGVNLAQFAARIFAGTEPPLDQVARDVWMHDTNNPTHDPTGKVFVDDTPVGGPGHPGYGTLTGQRQQGKYYLGLERRRWFHPTEWKRVDSTRDFDINLITSSGLSSIATGARRSPSLKRIVVWQKFFGEPPPPLEPGQPDPLEQALGAGWRRVDAADHNVRFHWTWGDLYVYRRTEYQRNDAGPASPR